MLTISVESTQPVAGKADLLASSRGQLLEVAVPRTLAAGVDAGMRMQCRAKRTPDGAMCEKDPAPGDFVVTTP